MSQGYGTIPKKVMKDKDLSIEAKAIYAYLQSYAGAGDTAYPSVSLMSKDLNISERRFYNHRKTLIDKGYILIKQTRNDKGWKNNIYTLPFNPTRQNVSTQNVSTQNVSTINNSLKNNSINSSSNAFAFYQNNFGVLSPFVAENIEHWINDLSEELVIESMKIALKANKKFNYAEGILKDWYRNNIKTLDDVQAKETERKKGSNKGDGKVARF